MSARAEEIRTSCSFRPRAWIASAAVVALVSLAGTGARTMAGPSVRVLGGNPAREAIVTWAVGRYQRAGLELPPIVLGFHDDPRECGDNSGFTVGNRIDMCTTGTQAYVRETLLHEMAHVWLEHHASEELRTSFLRLRRLKTWDGVKAPWGLRGVEQAAEIIAWGLGDGTIPPLVPDDDPDRLAPAFELLTGRRPAPWRAI